MNYYNKKLYQNYTMIDYYIDRICVHFTLLLVI